MLNHYMRVIFLMLLFLSLIPIKSHGDANKGENLTIDGIMRQIEAKYSHAFVTAHFSQISTLKAMDITDYAKGKVAFMHPGKMRWTYEEPETQDIITDGVSLWIYRPADNQVTLGKASYFFGDGKGAGFLSDIRLLRKEFSIDFAEKKAPYHYVLKLVPKTRKLDIAHLIISIQKTTLQIETVETYNTYGDKTLIAFSNIKFAPSNNDTHLFTFEIPKGIDILTLDE